MASTKYWGVICFAFGLAISTTTAQSQVQGLVVDGNTQDPLIGVNVYLVTDPSTGTITGPEGLFTLPIPPGVADTLQLSYIGYKKLSIPISEFGKQRKVIALHPRSFAMQEVVVSAEPLIAEEFSVKKIRKLEVYMNPNAKADPLLAVNSLPSATTTDESANISLRGSSPAETGIFFDNVPIYDAVRFSRVNGIGTFSIFNTAIVKDIQVFPGNPPLEFGNTTSGLISIQSDDRVPQKNSGSLALSLASISALRTHKLAPRTGLTVFTNLQPSGLFTGVNNRALPDLKKFNSADLGLHFIKRFDSKTSLKIFNYSLLESYNFQFRHPTFEGIFDQKRRRNFTVSTFKKIYDRSSFSINGGFSHAGADFGFSSTQMNVTSTYGYGSVNYHHLGKKLEAKLGATFDFRKVEFQGTVPEVDYAIDESHPTIQQTSIDKVEVPELYLYLKYSLGEKAYLGGGLRKNLAINNYQSYLSGQLNFYYAVADHHSLTFGIGSYNKFELPISGNQEAQLFQSDQISFDYSYQSSKVNATFGAFYKFGNQPDRSQRTYGFESFLESQLSKRIKTKISLTHLQGNYEDEGSRYPTEFDLSYFVRGSFEYAFPANWSLNTIFLLRQGVPYTPLSAVQFNSQLNVYQPIYSQHTNSQRLPGYSVVDLSLNKLWPVNEQLVVIFFATAGNILNKENVREINYNFDYSQEVNEHFSRRIIYFGAVLNFL